jgi:hypothetical protein
MRAAFTQVWAVDFEFVAQPGELPRPVCLTARELRSGRTVQVWEDELLRLGEPPYDVSARSLIVAYYAPAELLCHIALGWALPVHVLDLYAEFRSATNGRTLPMGAGLLGALSYYGIGGIDALDKSDMRELILKGGPWTAPEQRAILAYNATDVDALERLLPPMAEKISWPHALLRGRYMKAVARMEATGTPIDVDSLHSLRQNWSEIKDALIKRIDERYGVYDGSSFRTARFARWLSGSKIPWPTLQSGRLALDDDTFRSMAKTHPVVGPLRELRVSLGRMRLERLAVGSDGRNRCMLSPFRSKTGRNQPSNAEFIFGPAAWLRGLIRPAPGFGIAYVDYEQQEFGIAAALSGDGAMCDAYASGDPYLAFARQAGSVPPGATKSSHRREREMFKQAALAVQYGMGADALAVRLDAQVAQAAELLRLHRRTYPRYWAWSDSSLDRGMLSGRLQTVLGWALQIGPAANPRSLRNFAMQANGAEVLRIACCLATERGTRICAPIHDALLIEAPVDQLDMEVVRTQDAMAEAGAAILAGFELRTEVKRVVYPERYRDPRGEVMWATVMDILGEVGSDASLAEHQRTPGISDCM